MSSAPWLGQAAATSLSNVIRNLDVAGLWQAQYYECRLQAGQDRVDYLCAIYPAAARTLVQGTPTGNGDPARAGLARLLDRWLDPASSLAERVPLIWLEFDDVLGRDTTEVVPSVSVCLVPYYRPDRPLVPGVRERNRETAVEALRELLEGATPEVRSMLTDCFDQLPAAGRWIHLSVMLGRASRAIKLYGSFPRGELAPYLDTIGWCGDWNALDVLLRGPYAPNLVGNDVFVDLNLDTLRDSRRCSLGLAVGQQHVASGPDQDPTRRGILDRWVADGLCAEDRAEAARGWCTHRTRFLDLKLVWESVAGVTAKAYLGSHRSAA